MDWLTRMNAALAYIESNLTGEIDPDALAKLACCSSHNFYRVFSFITDVSLAEYIRRRKLTLAALELQNSDIKVVDLAVKYGYDSPVSFSRAFQHLHGLTPSEARTGGATLKAYPKMTFQISIKGANEMNYRIETKEAFQMFGIEEIHKDEALAKHTDLDGIQMVDMDIEDDAYEKLKAAAGDLPAFVNKDMNKIHALFGHRQTEEGTFPTMTCAFRSPTSNTAGYTIADIPAHSWAIFPSEKHEDKDLDEVTARLYKRIHSEWMPTANYEFVSDLELEVFGGEGADNFVEVWLPVKKK